MAEGFSGADWIELDLTGIGRLDGECVFRVWNGICVAHGMALYCLMLGCAKFEG